MKKGALLSVILILVVSVAGPVSAKLFVGFTSGAGWVVGPTGAKATFAVFARKQQDGTITGNLVYIDHGIDLRVTSTSLTAFLPGCQSEIVGEGDSNAGPVQFLVTLLDNGEPGTTDALTIEVTGSVAYVNAGLLGGGNIRAHRESCP